MSRLRNEDGFTLPELLVGMVISLLLLGATLTVFELSLGNAQTNDRRTESGEIARTALDRQARQLRNLAKRLNNTPVIDRVSGDDLIFQTSDPSRTWVRYCLDTSAGMAKGKLWESNLSLPVGTASSPVSTAMRGACPGTGWTSSTVVAQSVANRAGGQNRPVFYVLCADQTAVCGQSPAGYDQILKLTAQLIVDPNPGSRARELAVTTGVFLRNQNQPPVARFVSTATGSRTIVLNGSASSDQEGRTLSLFWFKDEMPTAIACDKSTVTIDSQGRRRQWGGVLAGEGVTLTHTFPATDGAAGATKRFGLVACDPGDRFGTAGLAPATPIFIAIP